MVKKITFLVFVIVFSFQDVYGQFVVGASQIDNAAQFEVVSGNKGVLLPRVQLTGTNDVTTIANLSVGQKESLLVYNTATATDVVPGYYYWDKTKWVALSGTDNQNLTLTGESLSIQNGNSVDLSSLNTDNQTLSLSGTTLGIQGGNSVNLSGLQDNLGNHNATTRLWMNGQEIQGAGNNTLINGLEVGQVGHGGSWLGIANRNSATASGYALIHHDNGTTLLNTESGQKIGFRVANQEKMTMDASGNFGVGVTSPSTKLDVNGNARIRSIANGATSDQVLTVDGNGNVRKVVMSTVGGQGDTDDQTLTFSGTSLSISEGNTVDLGTLNTDNQTLSLSGTTLGIQGGNSVNLDGLKDNLGNHTATTTLKMENERIVDAFSVTAGNSEQGKASIFRGADGNTGFIEFRRPDNRRTGYVGNDGTNIRYHAEIGAEHYFTGGTIQVRNTRGSIDLMNFLSGGDGLAWGNRGNDFGINFQTASSVQTGNIARISAGDVSLGSNTGNRYLGFQVGKDKQNTDTKLLYLLGNLNGTQRVGILNENPTATFDVNGNARIRTIAAGTTNDEVLTVDASGNVRKVTMTSVASKGDTDDQTLAFTGTSLSISEGNTVDLASLNTDNQTLSLSGTTLGIQGGNSVNLSGIQDNLGNHNATTRLWMNGQEIQGAGNNTLINGVEVGQVGHGGTWLGLANGSMATTTGYALIQNNTGTTLLNTEAGQKIGFRVANQEKMTMDASGNFGIGATSPSAKLDVNGNARIRSVAGGATSDQVLTVDASGNVRKVAMTTVGGQGDTDDQTLALSGNTLSISEGNSVNLSSINTDNQTLSLSGTTLGIQGGNSVNLAGLKDNLGNHTATTTLDMTRNKVANVDHIEFKKAGGDASREGYIGYNNTNMQYVSEQGNHLFKGGNVNIANLPAVTGSTFATVTENDGTLRKQTWESIKNWIVSQVPSSADNLGNHNATTRLWMNGQEIQGAGNNTLINGVEVGQVGHGGSWVGFANKNTATTTGYALIQNNVGNTLLNAESGQKINFRIANQDKMTLDASGNFGIGATSPTAKLDVNGNARIRSVAGGATSDQVLTVDASGNVRKVAMTTVGGQGDKDNQTLSFSGTTLGIQGGNSVNLAGLKDNLGNHTATTTLDMTRNKVANVDHIEFKKAGGDASREGYIGYNNTNMQYVSEQGNHLFKGGNVNIANLPTVTGSTYATVTENDGTLRKQTWQNIKNWIVSQVPSSADGDAWGVNGENQTGNITRSGNVGIGVSPSFKLHVNGRAKLDGADAGTWFEAGTNDWFLGRNGADLRFYNAGDKVTIKPNGDVGIGTSSPESKLSVIGNARVKSDQPNLFLDRDGKAVWRMYVSNGDFGIDPNDLVIRKQTAGTPYMVFNDLTGNVGIGGEKTQGHKLRVYGSVRASSFRSDSNSYPDYVFDHYYEGVSPLNREYHFPTLEEVEAFAKENHHLPGVTPYNKIKDGIDLSELSVQNLEKVEELYLHIIELNKTIKTLKEENKQLNTKLTDEMAQMNQRIEQLSKLVSKSSKENN